VASTLHHRNILAILDIGDDHDRPYVVSEHFVGESLASIIEDEAPFVADDVAILVEQLARGLEYGHQRGIVHGDLSPASVLIDASGLAKITQLGMIEGQHLLDSASRESIASNPYLPGGLQGNSIATHALDVHALSAIAYEMLVGQLPRGADHPSQQHRSVPERAGNVVLKGLLAYDQRTGLTAMQFSQALTNWRSMTDVAPTSDRRHDAQQWSRNRYSPSTRVYWPEPAGQVPTNHQSNGAFISHPQPKSSRIPRLLFMAVIVVAAAVIWIASARDSVQGSVTSSSFPEELTQLLQAVNE
jgi:serine/threonine protein kinase